MSGKSVQDDSEALRKATFPPPQTRASQPPHQRPIFSHSRQQSHPYIHPHLSQPCLKTLAAELPSPLPFSPFSLPTPSYEFLNNPVPTPNPAAQSSSSFPTWFYDLGMENSEEWLHMQLSGAGAQGTDGFDGWGMMASLPGGDPDQS